MKRPLCRAISRGRSRSAPFGSGQGRVADPERAASFMERAAEGGDAYAAFMFGRMCLQGRGVPVDLDRAETNLRKSAKADHLPAVLALAAFYSQGGAVVPDLREAAVWYRRGAEMGDVQAQFTIGRFAAEGIGMPPSPSEATRWFRQAAEQGHPVAAYNFASFLGNSAEPAATMAEAERWYHSQRKTAFRKLRSSSPTCTSAAPWARPTWGAAVNLLREASEAGDRNAKTQLALIYLSGSHGMRNSDPGRGAAAGRRRGLAIPTPRCIWDIFIRGNRIRRWRVPAMRRNSTRSAAEAGSAVAQHQLAALLSGENASPARLAEAANWFRRAAENGLTPSQFQMGVLLCTGRGVEADLAEATRWYERAAEGGHKLAMYNLGVMLLKGMGVEPDPARGEALIRQSDIKA